MKTDVLLDTLNKPTPPDPSSPPARVTPVERVASLTRAQLVDAYVDPRAVAGWMTGLGNAPALVLDMTQCLLDRAGGNSGGCYEDAAHPGFIDRAVKAPAWSMPRAPTSVNANSPDPVEVDAQRFLANAMTLAPSLMVLQQSLAQSLTREELATGIKLGAASAARYMQARTWHRMLQRPSNALVLSGGGANGAFSAGAVWRLLGILQQCRGKPAPEGCGDARIDLAAGTSTGALISTMVDLFHTPGQEQAARDLLVSNYTCTVESDLYCVNSTWLWNLAKNTRGLVRFDGVVSKLDAAIQPGMLHNDTELVAVSVDFPTGDVFGISDQDPADFEPEASDLERKHGLTQAIVASIVEPVLSDPVEALPSRSGKRWSAYFDGGVRSGLPLLQAVQRGAERVLVISTGGLTPPMAAKPAHAMDVLMRTLDLFVAQPRMGEVQQAELAAVTRRLAEYNVCALRLGRDDTGNIEAFCRRTGTAFQPHALRAPEAGIPLWMGPARFEQVATSWRTSWMFRPENDLASASGYAFSPDVMQPLFVQGVETFQKRCLEVLTLFNIQGTRATQECERGPQEVAAEARAALPSAAQCKQGKPERRTCD
ncbi:patatin-like phospholipase family protein [Corallococcus sp. H22C18031201]|nr:patatin-like phospholipase family protein [Corallococcus sp. H22C18031201]